MNGEQAGFTIEAVQPASRAGLAGLNDVPLSLGNQERLDLAACACEGPAPWRSLKRAQARDLLALTQLTDRLIVRNLSLREALRAMVQMRVPVPCMPAGEGDLIVGQTALLTITYRQEAMWQPQPGYSFVQVYAPRHLWHANVAMDHGQPICLGITLPRAFPLSEIIQLTYAALCMGKGHVMFDERDHAGVLNPRAAVWWQQNRHRLPLSNEPFLTRAVAK